MFPLFFIDKYIIYGIALIVMGFAKKKYRKMVINYYCKLLINKGFL